jgi:hypothetical protein
LILEPKFDIALPFKDGLAEVKVDGKWGIIDMAGNFIVEPRYSSLLLIN